MKARLIFFLKYYLFWIVFFVVQKPLFMLWQYRLLGDIEGIDWLMVPLHGLPLDLSVSAYLTAVVGVLLCVSFWVKWDIMQHVVDAFSGIVLFVGLWTVLGDNGCFPSWGYHLNKEIFTYLASPREALACAPWYVWILGCVAFVVMFMIWAWLYKKWFMYDDQRLHMSDLRRPHPWKRALHTFGMLVLTGLLFLPMRGSVTVSTMNTGRVYYSNNRMLNLAAVNPVFHIMETLSEDHFNANRYRYMPSEEANQRTKQLFTPGRKKWEKDLFLTTQRPNIVLVILESFSMNAMEAGAMPRLSQLAQEGVFFTNTYAASHRTDRGVMAVLGAFPGCATSSLMLVPSKSGQLPQIGQVLKREGYQLKFFYGGDEDFTNMRSYLITGGFEDRVADRDFPLADQMSKWGVPDHIVFNRVAQEIYDRPETDQRTFDVVLSLSSHEPFEVPYHHLDNEYLNAVAYTDSCLGELVDALRLSPKWDSTLIVMVADHGYPYPSGVQAYEPQQHRIPMVMAGGAIRAPREINTICQQVDWVPTILHQMGLDARAFRFARDVMDNRIQPFAYYNFVDGFGLVTDTAVVVYDAEAERVIVGEEDSVQIHQAKAMTQSIMETIYQL